MFMQGRGWKKIPHLILDPVGVTCVVCCCSCLEVWRTVKPSSGSLENTPKRQPKDRGEAQPCSTSFSKFQAAGEWCLLLPFPTPPLLPLASDPEQSTYMQSACLQQALCSPGKPDTNPEKNIWKKKYCRIRIWEKREPRNESVLCKEIIWAEVLSTEACLKMTIQLRSGRGCWCWEEKRSKRRWKNSFSVPFCLDLKTALNVC